LATIHGGIPWNRVRVIGATIRRSAPQSCGVDATGADARESDVEVSMWCPPSSVKCIASSDGTGEEARREGSARADRRRW